MLGKKFQNKYIISLFCILILILPLTLGGCVAFKTAQETSQTKEINPYYQFTDDLGNVVTLLQKPQKIVALMGSYGEMWMLAGGELAGVTEDAVTERNLDIGEKTQIIGTVKAPNSELILQIMPELVLLSTDIEAHLRLSDTLKASKIPYAYFKEDSVSDYLRILKIYTDITGRADLYEIYGESVEKKVNGIIEKVSKMQVASDNISDMSDMSDKEEVEKKPKVLLIRSMSSKAKALNDTHMVGMMLKDLGADNIASRHDILLDELSMETIIEENPDYIFVVTMGKTDAAVKTLENGIMANPAWNSLDAVKNDNFIILPKDLFQYKPNAKWGESYEYLEKILYE